MNASHPSVDQVFSDALRHPTGPDRAAFLDDVCGCNAELRQRVDRLLRAHDDAASFLESPAVEATATTGQSLSERPGTLIGPYKLLEQIGEGGFGVVYMAEQHQPVRRRVALKIIKPGMEPRQVIARFEAERQALTLMDHPNIAKVLDAGTTENGRPYFVMDLVKGQPITTYCDEHRVTPRQRLELFLPVCQAIQHAHQKGIIHRDIKPSNVLVAPYDGRPVVKVIDFGVAKATGQRLTEKTLFTEFGAVIGTLEYMSPEQAELNNQDIDTRSDIYSLGVLLYELLTGTTPLIRAQLKQAAFTEMLRVIREQDPPQPSTRLCDSQDTLPTISAQRQMESARLTRLVRGELDWIVMKALEKDRDRRYETAGALAGDLQHFLDDEPVLACPPSASYRMRKFLRRNRSGVLAASLVLLALAIGIVSTSIGLVQAQQAREAEAQRALGERLAKETAEKRLVQIEKGMDILGSIFENLDPRAEEKEGLPLREILGGRLDQAAAQLADDAVGDPLVVARMQDRLGRTYLGLGYADKAEALFTKALATRNAELGADDPDSLNSMLNQALAYQTARKLPQAIERFEQVRDVQQKKLGADHPDTLATLNYLGVAYRLAKRSAVAIAVLEQVGKARAKRLGADDPETLTTLHCLAAAYRADGKLSDSIDLYEHVCQARVKRLAADHPDTLTTLHHLAMAYRHAGRMPEAIAMHEQLRDAQLKRLGLDHPHTLTAINNLAGTYRSAGKATEAITLYEQVRDARVRRLEADQHGAFITLIDLAEAYASVGNLEQAVPLLHQAARGVEARKFLHPQSSRIVRGLSACYEDLKQYEQAEVWRRKWLAVLEDTAGPDSAAYAVEQSALGANLLQQERYAEAEPFLLSGYEGMNRHDASLPVEGPRSLIAALERLVQLYEDWDKPDDAAKWQAKLGTRTKEVEAKQDSRQTDP
jgi:non-specific serine/threonine protein kinase/serine/threonine-protein kinase